MGTVTLHLALTRKQIVLRTPTSRRIERPHGSVGSRDGPSRDTLAHVARG
jgi:hypothetical protein